MRDYIKERKHAFENILDRIDKALDGLNCMEGRKFNVENNDIYNKLKNDITIPLISHTEIYIETGEYQDNFSIKTPMFLTYKYLLDLKKYYEGEINKINNGTFILPDNPEEKIHKESATPELYTIYKKDRDKINRKNKLKDIFSKDSD